MKKKGEEGGREEWLEWDERDERMCCDVHR